MDTNWRCQKCDNMNKCFIIITLTLIFTIKSFGFDFPKTYQQSEKPFKQDSSALYFDFYNCNFVWNNEYFNDVVEGYTLIGYHATPTLRYHFNKNIKIEAGVHLLKYSGIDSYSTVKPVYSATYQNKDFALIFGTLSGTANHNLQAPIYFFERYFTDNLESGLQYLLKKSRVDLDLWVDWRNFIFENDNEQEKLTAGFSTQYYPVKNDNWKITVPVSVLLIHQGGQIDTSDIHMKTAMNYSLGVNVLKPIPSKWITAVQGEVHFMGFSDNSPTVESIYEKGQGYLGNIQLKHNESFLEMGYWYGYHFLSVMGNPMYQCHSTLSEDKNQTERSLVNVKLFLDKRIYRGIHLSFLAETFYDTKNGNFDYSTGLSLLIDESFFVKRFSK